MLVQLKAWEEYTLKLEEKYVALMTEHESFQRELASVRGILDDGTDPDIHGTSLLFLTAHPGLGLRQCCRLCSSKGTDRKPCAFRTPCKQCSTVHIM